MRSGDWIALGAFICSAIAVVLSYARHPSLVSSSRVDEFRALVEEQREELKMLKKRISELEIQTQLLREEARFWQDEYRKLKGEEYRKIKGTGGKGDGV